jgi:AcrR family transcriptional regulator
MAAGHARAPGRPPGDTSQQTREALLHAALETFAEVGYDRASTRAILARSGLAAPALYYHFRNKVGLYEAVARQVNDVVVARLREAAASGATLGDSLRAVFRCSADLHEMDRSFTRFLVNAPAELRFHEDLRQVAGEMNRVLDLLRSICQDHRDEIDDVGAAVDASHVLMQGLTRFGATVSNEHFRTALAAIEPIFDGPPFRRTVRGDPVSRGRARPADARK